MTRLSTIAALFVLTAASSQTFAQYSNPIVGGSDSQHISYDPWNDTTYIDTTKHRIRESAYDHDRHMVDYGSKKYVDRYFKDQHGRTVHEYGWTWTTNGKPHGDLTREVVTYTPNRPKYHGGGCSKGGGGFVERDKEIISYGNQGGYTNSGGNGGTFHKDKKIVSYSHIPSQPQQPPRPPTGGTVKKDSQIISYGAQSTTNKSSQLRNNINRWFNK